MFDKFIKINEKRIIAGQTSSGVWYCKELMAETPNELKTLISDINKILNDYNNNIDKKTKDKKK